MFLDLIEREETDLLAGYLLGKHFLVSSMTGGIFHGPTDEPQALHRDQGQVPATADFPAACNLFWCLDDFTPEAGSTHIIPGSHRWAPEHLINPPAREMSVQVEIPAGSVFSWEGRLWHGAGANRDGSPRRHIANYYCLPWMRQQENWGVTCLQDVIDNASPRLRARLGMRTYGTLGMMSGTRVDADWIDAEQIEREGPDILADADAILVPGGFGGRGFEGKIAAAGYARVNKIPYLGICYGLHAAIVEFARNEMGLEGANTTEIDPTTPYPMIGLITEWQDQDGSTQHRDENSDLGGSMRMGAQECLLEADSLSRQIYGAPEIFERHRHRYEVNDKFVPMMEQAGMRVAGRSADASLVEMIEADNHPWFVASQFHPEFTSTPRDGHPLFKSFVEAAIERHAQQASLDAAVGDR